MTQENKELLLKDLFARLPYGVIVETYWEFENKKDKTFPKSKLTPGMLGYYIGEDKWKYNTHFLPFLRKMSSMTEEERKEYKHLVAFSGSPNGAANFVDWLNKKMFAYRTIDGKDMFELGLALEAPKDMYK